MVDIFDEIDEDLRAERVQRVLKRYAGAIAAGLLLIVAAAAAWQGWHWWQTRRDADAATAYLRAMTAADATRPAAKETRAEAAQSFARAATRTPEGYATLARLRAAALLADNGDRGGAVAAWDEVAGDRAADPLLRDLASLYAVQSQLDTGDPAALRARLAPLTVPDNPWHGLALETEGLLDMRVGQMDAAAAAFRGLAQDATAPDGVRARATSLLNQLGR